MTAAGIGITRIWSDEDMAELDIQVRDGTSLFSNRVYVDHQHLRNVVSGLEKFKGHIYGGIYDLRFGSFGPEYAAGALDARLHFQDRGRIFITVRAQTEFIEFGKKRVASEATLHLISVPAQLDEFIRALRAVSEGYSDTAELAAQSPE